MKREQLLNVIGEFTEKYFEHLKRDIEKADAIAYLEQKTIDRLEILLANAEDLDIESLKAIIGIIKNLKSSAMEGSRQAILSLFGANARQQGEGGSDIMGLLTSRGDDDIDQELDNAIRHLPNDESKAIEGVARSAIDDDELP